VGSDAPHNDFVMSNVSQDAMLGAPVGRDRPGFARGLQYR
jgi:hypothetical protein